MTLGGRMAGGQARRAVFFLGAWEKGGEAQHVHGGLRAGTAAVPVQLSHSYMGLQQQGGVLKGGAEVF